MEYRVLVAKADGQGGRTTFAWGSIPNTKDVPVVSDFQTRNVIGKADIDVDANGDVWANLKLREGISIEELDGLFPALGVRAINPGYKTIDEALSAEHTIVSCQVLSVGIVTGQNVDTRIPALKVKK